MVNNTIQYILFMQNRTLNYVLVNATAGPTELHVLYFESGRGGGGGVVD